MEEVKDRDVGDVLGLLESAQEEVVQEVRSILKDTLATVREGWLVSGLLQFFFVSNSGRLLDIVLGVSEPHDRHLLERIAEGLRGADRFRYTCLLLYAVRRQPTPMWLRKLLHHGAMRELLNTIVTEEEVPVLVSGVMVLVMLLPILPLEMARLHLSSILEIFCRLARWTPKQEPDECFQPYLQVAVYSLFHRLYALYPCHFITCLQNNFTKPGSSACFFTTLKPMMESVRFHPILITESKETEITKSRWMGLETHQLIQECSKLCIDPAEATCEDTCGSNFLLGGGSDYDALPVPTNWMVSASGNNFWSPSLAQSSPAMMGTSSTSRGSNSVPHTPVFPILTPRSASKVAESPPEAAIEATPETTPFTSPLKLEGNSGGARRPVQSMRALTLSTGGGGGSNDSKNIPAGEGEVNCSPLSPLKKDQPPFRFPEKQNQDFFMRAERSVLLQSRLQQIQRDRQQTNKENYSSQSLDIESREEESKDSTKENVIFNKSRSAVKSIDLSEVGVGTKLDDFIGTATDVRSRRRKVSVYDGAHHVDISQFSSIKNVTNGSSDGNVADADMNNESTQIGVAESNDKNFSATNIIDRRISEEKESDSSESRRSSDEQRVICPDRNCEEAGSVGLGVPSQKSMTDLVKNVRTMRLRFLSQCGPPPDLSQYKLSASGRNALSPTKSGGLQVRTLQKSSSCPQLAVDEGASLTNGIEIRVRKESAMSSLTLSPTRQAVITSEATTQTEEVNVINPYEQLLDALVSGPTHVEKTSKTKNDLDSDYYSPSPHKLLDEYIRHCNEAGGGAENVWQQQKCSASAVSLKNQVRLMQSMVLLERYKREVHAERNRRLLGRAKKVYALEEQQQGLKREVCQLESEIARLKHDLHNLQLSTANKEQQLQSALNQQQGKLSQICVERDNAQQERDLLREQCKSLGKENTTLAEQLNAVHATLAGRERQLTVQARLAEDNCLLRRQVEILHKQMSLMGEVQDQYKHHVWKLSVSSQGNSVGLALERETAQKQVEDLEGSNRITNIKLDAALARVNELETALAEKEKIVTNHQKDLRSTREAGLEQCRAVERRCQALAATNQTLESYILEHNDRIDRLVRQVRRSQRGKSVCSDGFDIDLELSASPSSASCSSAATSPPDDPLLSRQPIVLSRLDALAELEVEPEGRRKT